MDQAKIKEVRAHIVAGLYHWVIIEITTECGLTGWGEAATDRGVAGVIAEIGTDLMGESATNINLTLTKLRRKWSGMGSGTGAFMGAFSGIEMALWDIKGKKLGVPVHSLLGGALRDQINQYMDCHVGTEYSPKGFRDRAVEVVDWGFTALKFDLDDPVIMKTRGFIPKLPRQDQWSRRMTPDSRRFKAKLMETVREAVGPNVEVGIDFHWYYTPGDIRKFAEDVAPYDIAFFEDPISPFNNIDALKDLSMRIDIPILCGELLYSTEEFRQAVASQALAILAPEITRVGGIGGCVEVAKMADLYGILVSPHNVNSMIATAALAHAAAVIPNLYFVEYRYREDDWWDALVHSVDGKPFFDGAQLHVPQGPGLGIEINRSLLEEKTVRVIG